MSKIVVPTCAVCLCMYACMYARILTILGQLVFSPERGEWRKKNVDIKVAEAMYAKGAKMACICFRDLLDDK
jgi:hypothetical protein